MCSASLETWLLQPQGGILGGTELPRSWTPLLSLLPMVALNGLGGPASSPLAEGGSTGSARDCCQAQTGREAGEPGRVRSPPSALAFTCHSLATPLLAVSIAVPAAELKQQSQWAAQDQRGHLPPPTQPPPQVPASPRAGAPGGSRHGGPASSLQAPVIDWIKGGKLV